MSFKILSIDGGGTRGLFPVTILKKLEEETGQSVYDHFDLIIGSATGGIIVTALAANVSVADIQDIYLNKASELLPKNIFRQNFFFNPLNLIRSRYTNKGLIKALTQIIGDDKTMDDVFTHFGEDTLFLVPALDLHPELKATDIPAFRPVIYNSASHVSKCEKLIDIALRTSAAAVNLPVYQRFGEGGNYANDPSIFALSFALAHKADPDTRLSTGIFGLNKKPDDIKMLSLGCGSTGSSYVHQKYLKKKEWGLWKWQRFLISLVIESNMVANKYLAEEILPDSNYLRINTYYKGEMAPSILKNKKLKIDVTDKEQLQAIKDYAEQIFDSRQSDILSFIS